MLQRLGTTLVQAQQWQEAHDVLKSIQDTVQRSEALQELATALVQAQQWQEARTVIDSIQQSKSYTDLLCALGTALAHAQRWQEANAIWAEVHEALKSIQDEQIKSIQDRERQALRQTPWPVAGGGQRTGDVEGGGVRGSENRGDFSCACWL